MNKLFTLTALGLLVSLSATAQKVRKTWDFREGFSTATVANLAADMEQNGLRGKVLGMFFCFIVFCIFAL